MKRLLVLGVMLVVLASGGCKSAAKNKGNSPCQCGNHAPAPQEPFSPQPR